MNREQTERARQFIQDLDREIGEDKARHNGYSLFTPEGTLFGYVRYNVGGAHPDHYTVYAYTPFLEGHGTFKPQRSNPNVCRFTFGASDRIAYENAVKTLRSSYDYKSGDKTADRFSEVLRRHLPELKKQFEVSNLALFGSYVRGEQDRYSDLDVLVEYSAVPTMFEFLELQDRLSELLGVNVDLVMKSALKERLGKEVLREMVAV